MYCNSFEGRVFLNATAVAGVAGTTEQTLMTYSLPGNSLYKAGQGLRIRAGFLNNASDTITWKLYFGTVVLSQSCTTTTGGEAEIDVAELAAKSHATVTRGRAADTTLTKATFATDSQDDTAAIVIKLTATATASGANATAEYLSVEFLQNA
jgi:hypothetical protein